MKVASVDEIRKLDRLAVEKYGIDDILLMENAGNAVYYLISEVMGVKGRRFTVLAGPGNNGGDALVVARKLYSSGGLVDAFIVGNPDKFRGSARKNYEVATRIGLIKGYISDEAGLNKLGNYLHKADAVIDGIFGTGLSREVKGVYREVISAINNAGKTVFSIDIPSGVGGNDGKIYGVAVKASYTVTFGLPKIGNLLYPGYAYNGKLLISHISYPQELTEFEEVRVEVNIPPPLPERIEWGHKGTFGKALFVAGARNYYGAPVFSALSFLKAGGGYSRLAAPESIIPYIAGRANEVVYIPLRETSDGSIAKDNLPTLLDVIEKYGIDVLVVGPGTGLNPETQELVRNLIRDVEKPVIVDGDGLTAIAQSPEYVASRKSPTALTPHPGELSRLTGWKVKEILDRKVDAVKEAASKFNSYVLLKGAHTLIGTPTGEVYINLTGNSGMATAGSGDVLTGTIAAMYGLGYSFKEAVKAGVLIHGLAGDLAASNKGEDGITANDILEHIPNAVREWRERREEVLKKYLPRTL